LFINLIVLTPLFLKTFIYYRFIKTFMVSFWLILTGIVILTATLFFLIRYMAMNDYPDFEDSKPKGFFRFLFGCGKKALGFKKAFKEDC